MMRFMSDGHVFTPAETRSWLTLNAELRNETGFSVWAADLKPETTFVGWLGVTEPRWFPELMPTPEIGWFIDRAYWGQGLATEGAVAAVEFAFEQLEIERLIGIYNPENLASGRVMEKIGMTFWNQRPHPRYGFPLRIYQISR
jgi:RimJ/RimL family protein N-acetyltransferase